MNWNAMRAIHTVLEVHKMTSGDIGCAAFQPHDLNSQ